MRSTSLLRFKLGSVDKFFSIKGFGFVSGDDGTQYYLSRSNVGNNPMMVFGGERVRFEALLTDKTPECISLTQPDGKPFSRTMQYGVMFRTGEECTIYAGDKSYPSVSADDIVQKDLIRGKNAAGSSVGAPVCFYVEKGTPQSVIRSPGPSRKRSLPSNASGGFEAVNTISNSSKRGDKAFFDDSDIANLLDSFETK